MECTVDKFNPFIQELESYGERLEDTECDGCTRVKFIKYQGKKYIVIWNNGEIADFYDV